MNSVEEFCAAVRYKNVVIIVGFKNNQHIFAVSIITINIVIINQVTWQEGCVMIPSSMSSQSMSWIDVVLVYSVKHRAH